MNLLIELNRTSARLFTRKIIVEITPGDLVAGCEFVGRFEENMTKVMKLCERLDAIVFIDEIHTIYGTGASLKKNNDMAAM
ncbi:MAG: AAA family ATPase [Bacilli bacterium]